MRVSSKPIDSPLISRPNVLIAMNEPSLRKFLPAVEPGGLVLYDGDDPGRPDVHMVARPFTVVADRLGAVKAANMVMLGALLGATAVLDPAQVLSALGRLVRNPKYFEADVAAVEADRKESRVLPLGDFIRE